MASGESGPPSWKRTTPTRGLIRTIRRKHPKGRDDKEKGCCSSNDAMKTRAEKPRQARLLQERTFVARDYCQARRPTGSGSADLDSASMASMVASANSEVLAVPPTSRVR